MSLAALPELALEPGTLAIADLHLDAADEARPQAFGRWLDTLVDVPRLVILGDLFDAWVGPAHARLEGARTVLAALARLRASGAAIDFVPGNRDFLVGEDFERATGARVRTTGFIGTSAAAGRVLFVHGDELCTLDRSYQRLRRAIRSRPVTWLAPRIPLPLATRLARRLRRASMRALEIKPAAEKAMQEGACRELAGRYHAAALVCGHAHDARDEQLSGGPRWIVLDAFGDRRDVLAVGTNGGLGLRASAIGELEADRYAPSEYGAPSQYNGAGGPVGSAPPMTVIAIDGPAGAGKSSVARALANELGLAFLDTGAMYRGVALECLRRELSPSDGPACEELARELVLEFDADGGLTIDGRSAEPDIRSARVDAVVSEVSAHPGVRRALVPRQRAAAEAFGGVVAEGRDMGTVVFPDASHKFFLTASAGERARRRVAQHGGDHEEVQRALERRDRYDSTRADSPLTRAPDALEIDTDGTTVDGVVARLLELVRASAAPPRLG